MLSRTAQVVIVVLVVLLIRLPFLNQAIQGDDYYYLKGAEHALIDPLHPHHAEYLFQGVRVTMRGHPHPPLNSWILAGLLATFGDVYEIPFHAAYIVFSLIAALSALAIARRFTPRPLIATLLFLAVPPFLVNGNSLESDLPFVAFWLAAIACYLYDRPILATLAIILAGLTAFQSILLAPILFLAPSTRRHWVPILAAPVTFAAFQLFERLTGGTLPAQVLAGYMQSYELQTLTKKLKNAIALTGHLAVTLISPIAWFGRREPLHATRFLYAWIAIFFAGALAIFFAGAARYLLPIALPLAILVSTSRFAIPAIAIQAALGIGLAIVNYQHWDAYRQITRNLPKARRIWVNAELGLRHYAEAAGAMPIPKGQDFRAGDVIVSSAYNEKIAAPLGLLSEHEVNSKIPLRIISLGGKSGYSTIDFGLLPFEITRKPLDRVRIETVIRKDPTLEYLKNGTPEAIDHALAGISAGDQWTFQQASFLLKRPPEPARARAIFYLPAPAAGRAVTLSIDGQPVARLDNVPEGIHTLNSPLLPPSTNPTATLTIATDRPFRPSNDQRELGVLLTEIGFVKGSQ